MKKLYQKDFQAAAWSSIKLVLSVLAIILIARYTGAFSGFSAFANTAVLKTGALNASPGATTSEKDFNYDFKLKDAAGKLVDVKDFKNKTIFLNLWATWCGPCRAEMPSIQNLYSKVDHDKIVFVMLTLDKPEHDAKVTKYIAEYNFTFPVYRLADGLPEELNVTSIPTTFVISPEGKIVSKKVGATNYDNEAFLKYLQGL